MSEASILYLRLRHHPVHEVMGSGSPSPRASRVMVWVMSDSMDKASHCWGGFVMCGRERVPSRLTFLAGQIEFQIGRFDTM